MELLTPGIGFIGWLIIFALLIIVVVRMAQGKLRFNKKVVLVTICFVFVLVVIVYFFNK